MARGAVATKKKSAAGRAVIPAKGKGSEDLSSLAMRVRSMEATERAKTGSNISWLTLVQGNTGIVKPGDPAYIKGVKLLDYVIPSKKLRLGQKVEATVLGMFKLYEQRTKGDKDKLGALVGFWMPEDAEQVPQSGIFERQLANGDVLNPVHWVFLYLHDHPEIDDALLSFRSIGNAVYKDLEKMLKAETALWSEVRLEISNQAIRNDKHKTTNYYPDFEIVGRNFSYADDKVSPVKGGLAKDEIAEILKRSEKLLADYTGMKMVSKRNNVAALIGGTATKALPAANGGYEEDDSDEDVSF
jgi:hypothetical protein